MSYTPEQEAAIQLAQVMNEKGIKWEWRKRDQFINPDGAPGRSETIELIKAGPNQYGKVQVFLYGSGDCYVLPHVAWIPLPDIERCLGLLKDWGWALVKLKSLDYSPEEEKYEITFFNLKLYDYFSCRNDNKAHLKCIIEAKASDPTTAAILACVEAARKK